MAAALAAASVSVGGAYERRAVSDGRWMQRRAESGGSPKRGEVGGDGDGDGDDDDEASPAEQAPSAAAQPMGVSGRFTTADVVREHTNAAPDGTRFVYFRDGSHLQIHPARGLQVEVWADGTKEQLAADGARLTVRPDEVKVAVLSDGTRITSQVNGDVLQVGPDGSRLERLASDGSTRQVNADGSVIVKDALGVMTATFADGVVLVERPDGSATQTGPDKAVIERFPDGKRVVTTAKTRETVFPDQSRVRENLETGEIVRTSADGATEEHEFAFVTVVKRGDYVRATRPDGGVVEHFPDGTTKVISARDARFLHLRS